MTRTCGARAGERRRADGDPAGQRPALHRAAGLLVLAMWSSACAGAPPAPRHIIYLHGRIVQEEESARPRHPQHGHYEFEQIAAELRKRGFAVTAQRRAKGSSVDAGVTDTVEQVQALLQSGVPADRITLVGASMGAAIAIRAAARLGQPELRVALLGPCISGTIPAVTREMGMAPAGRILSIREETDVPSAECPPPAATQAREVVLNTGLAHGFLYRPLPEWLEPVTEWASQP